MAFHFAPLQHPRPFFPSYSYVFGLVCGAACRNPLDLWRQAYEQFFPPDTEAREKDTTDPCAGTKYQLNDWHACKTMQRRATGQATEAVIV